MEEFNQEPIAEEIIDAEPLASGSEEENDALDINTKKESKVIKNLRRIGVWVLAFVGFGVIVFLLAYFLMYRPLSLEHQALTENSEAMETQLTEYRDDVDKKTSQISALEDSLTLMEEENLLYGQYTVYLKLLNNLAQMQKATIMGDDVSMRVAVANAQMNLDQLLPLLTEYDTSLADLLQQRLTLLATTDGMPDEVYQEVETMYVYLLELQETLFGDVY
ncbi:MAG: hypothetical protein J7K85_09220 [Anaerolineaceae bacterium]|nr:hypothetical protein [Anaerolineaceae bacterium]